MVVNAENRYSLAGQHFSRSDSASAGCQQQRLSVPEAVIAALKWQVDAIVPIAATRLQITNVQLSTSYRDEREI